VHLFCIELMPDFQPTSEVTWLSLSPNQTFLPLTMILIFYPQNTVPAPLARAIAYNAVCPISALGFRSPTLA
jgi:hypothetical protein